MSVPKRVIFLKQNLNNSVKHISFKFHPEAEEEFLELDKGVRERVTKQLVKIASHPELLASAKKIASSAKEEYEFLEGTVTDSL